MMLKMVSREERILEDGQLEISETIRVSKANAAKLQAHLDDGNNIYAICDVFTKSGRWFAEFATTEAYDFDEMVFVDLQASGVWKERKNV